MTDTLKESEMWSAYWEGVGRPDNPGTARRWWTRPGPLPEGRSLALFRAFAPIAVQVFIRDFGLPPAWLEATLLRFQAR